MRDSNSDEEGQAPLEQEAGPEQSGATGRPREESGDNVEEFFYGNDDQQQQQQNQGGEANTPLIVDSERDRLLRRLNHTVGLPVVDYPEHGNPINDFATHWLQAKAFPTLFPYGVGDVTMKERASHVSMSESIAHLIKFAYKDCTGAWVYPFMRHSCWLGWAVNTAGRHRSIGQRNVFLRNSPEVASMTEENLCAVIHEGGEVLDSLIGRMTAYNSNILGSPSYLYTKKMHLEELMEQSGMCTIWFTLSAADNHWLDLSRLFGGDSFPVNGTEHVKEKWRRKSVRENQHIVDAFFNSRVEAFVEAFLKSSGMEAEYTWFRIEYQERGTAHAHGCFRLKCDPGIADLGQTVLQGRIAALALHKRMSDAFEDMSVSDDGGSDFDFCDWPADDIACDEWGDEFNPDDIEDIANQSKESLQDMVTNGIKAQNIILTFNDFLLTSWHPGPPNDSQSQSRCESTVFKSSNESPHPSTADFREFVFDPADHIDCTEHYCKCINAVQRHKCQLYCKRKVRYLLDICC